VGDPELVVHYRDSITRAMGTVVIDTLSSGVVIAGVRIDPVVRWQQLASLARLSTLRYQLARLPIGGARINLSYDPNAPDALRVFQRFLFSISPFLRTVVSLDADAVLRGHIDAMLTKMHLPWRLFALQQHQGWARDQWVRLQNMLNEEQDGIPLRELQVAHGLAIGTRTMTDSLFHRSPTIAIAGGDPIALQAARILAGLGATVIAIGPSSGAAFSLKGLNPAHFSTQLFTKTSENADRSLVTLSELLSLEADVLIVTPEEAVTVENVGRIRAQLVVEAGPNAISADAEKVLIANRIPVLPSFVVTMGSILIADRALQGRLLTVDEALEYVDNEVRDLVREVNRLSNVLRISLRDAAVRLAYHRSGSGASGPPLALPAEPDTIKIEHPGAL
jgi:glutamate dehydrogenase/leucine dehydrogenase